MGVQNVQNARGRHGCVEHMVAPQASVQAALGQCKSRTKYGGGSAAPCFAEARGEVNGAVLRG